MFGFGKNKDKHKPAQKTTGYQHGLAFIDGDVKWVVPVKNQDGEPQLVVLVTGSKADDIGERLVSSIASGTNSMYMIDFRNHGLVSDRSVDGHTAVNIREARDLLKTMSGEMFETLKSQEPGTPVHGGPLLVVNGIRPSDVEEGTPGSRDVMNGGRTGSPMDSRLDADLDVINESREALAEVIGSDVASSVELALNMARADTFPAVVTRWSILDRISMMGGMPIAEGETVVEVASSNEKTFDEDEGAKEAVIESNDLITAPTDPVIVNAVEALRIRHGEGPVEWARRNAGDVVTAQAALALTQCDDRIGLPWPPVEDEERAKQVEILRDAVTGFRNRDDGPVTPLQDLWVRILDWVKIACGMGAPVVVVAEEPVLDALAPLLPFANARVIAGELPREDEWVAGIVNEDSITRYGTGDLQVVSKAKLGRLHTMIGTLRSPRMSSSRTMIDFV